MTDHLATLHCRLTDWSATHVEAWIEDPRRLQSPTPATYEMAALAGLVSQSSTPLRCVVWLAPAMTLEMTATVPAMSASQLRGRIPYAIEDSLIDDVEAEHFALGAAESLPNGQLCVPVRIVKRTALRAVLQQLHDQAGLAPDAVHAEADALPAKPGDLQLWIEGEQVRLRHPDGRWLVTAAAQLQDALAWWCPQGAAELGLWVMLRRSDRAAWEARLDAIGGFSALRWQLTDDTPLCWLASRVGSEGPINLLQAEFATTPRPSLLWQHWKWPIGWAAVAAVLLIAMDLSVSHRQAQDEAALDQALGVWRTTIADSTRQTQEPLTPLSAGLGLASAVQTAWAGTEVQALQMDEATVTISLANATEPPPDLVDHWTAILAPMQLTNPVLSRSESGWRLSAERSAP